MQSQTLREAFMQDHPDAHVAYWEGKLAENQSQDALETYRLRLFLAIAQYSRGDGLEVVRASVQHAVAALDQDKSAKKASFRLEDPTEFYTALWGLSLSIVFGDATPEFLHRGIGQDAIYDRLLKFTGALLSPVNTVLFPNSYQSLLDVMENPKQNDAAIAIFLRSWYAGIAKTPWFDTHLTQDPAFFGYWSFELAAVVKALDINDLPFADNLFYPRDLVHQRLFRTWLDSPQGEGDRAAKAMMGAQAQIQNVQDLLLKMFEGTGSADDQAAVNQGLKSIGSLLGFSQNSVEEDPQQLQMGMLQAFKTISEVSKNALQSAQKNQNPETEKLFAIIRDFESELAKQDAELANLTKDAENVVAEEASKESTQDDVQASKDRLDAIQAGMEKLLADQSIGFEGVFAGMERVMEQFAARLNIPEQKERDIVAEVSAQVSKDLQEANKKNMIGEDFDWSSIWKKTE